MAGLLLASLNHSRVCKEGYMLYMLLCMSPPPSSLPPTECIAAWKVYTSLPLPWQDIYGMVGRYKAMEENLP